MRLGIVEGRGGEGREGSCIAMESCTWERIRTIKLRRVCHSHVGRTVEQAKRQKRAATVNKQY